MCPRKPNEVPSCLGCFRLRSQGTPCPLAGQNKTGEDAHSWGQAVPRKVLLLQGTAVLLPPVLGFAAGFTLTDLLFPLSGEALRAAAGAALMFLFAFGVYLFRRRSPSESS
ncbi:MAG: hypothetical protein LBG07_11040 [Treponema sp.]|jgi:sigma-E factor negative regulatory protein RseC|nr:hypothetical protein [Treponema sp.]